MEDSTLLGEIVPEKRLPEGIPSPYFEPASPESAAYRSLRRMDWESLQRCVDRLREGDTFNASWTSGLIGVAATALIGLVTILLTSSSPPTNALIVLGTLTVMATLSAFLVFKVEERSRKERVSHLDALKEEMAAMERYMTSPEAATP
jgi:hypothetical protein